MSGVSRSPLDKGRSVYRFDHAAQAFLTIAAYWRSWMPVRCEQWPHGHYCWRRGDQDLAGLIRFLDEEYGDEIRLGIPQERIDNGGVGRVSMLWARVSGNEQLQRAQRFRPRPTLVIQEGTSTARWLIWWLERPMSYFDVIAANRKLAYGLHAVQKSGDPDAAWIPAPGSMLRGKPVRVTRLTTASFELPAVVAHLKEPPDRFAWLDAARS